MQNQITNKIRTVILTRMFGSVEEFNVRRSERLFFEYSSALSFCRNHNVTDDNVEAFAEMFIRPVVEYSADREMLVDGVNIPFSDLDSEKSMHSRHNRKRGENHKEYSLRDYLYMGMYSAVYKHTAPYRDSILRGDLSAARAVREETFKQWKEELYRRNGRPTFLTDLVEVMKVPKIVPSLWKALR